MLKKISTIFIIILTLTIVYAQENQVKISHVGYGNTPQEVKLTVHNIGDSTLHKFTYYLDGKLVRSRNTVLEPTTGISITFSLDPGKHLLEVNTSEGAYDSLEMTISPVQQKDSTSSQGESISFTETNTFKVFITFALVSVVVICLLMKKPKLDL